MHKINAESDTEDHADEFEEIVEVKNVRRKFTYFFSEFIENIDVTETHKRLQSERWTRKVIKPAN